jgi:hypothetical protein
MRVEPHAIWDPSRLPSKVKELGYQALYLAVRL